MEYRATEALKVDAYRCMVLEHFYNKIDEFQSADMPQSDEELAGAMDRSITFNPDYNSTIMLPRPKYERMEEIVNKANNTLKMRIELIKLSDNHGPFPGDAEQAEVCILYIQRDDGTEHFVCSVKCKRKSNKQKIILYLRKDEYTPDERKYKDFFVRRYGHLKKKWVPDFAENAESLNDSDTFAPAYAIVTIGKDVPHEPIAFETPKRILKLVLNTLGDEEGLENLYALLRK